ncbi:L-serine ammonia-lyase, iron-sulfur-dependent, subunit beta [Paenibacillus peoriae]|uniref:L-serine ammonia-lyase, iron-sulfur-dependent, subunit beta n=1 Tax=Paenibacillus peoriae TaxID=59893 RepID=UPI002116394C|nr:L-serine ammonia-lyase, iron-sulfur-dependent, subunit alpha [Paenibacillus peoriae]
MVTAPTCGASGVMPAALLYMQQKKHVSDEQIPRALAVGGLIGNLVKQNASISGAKCGCQGEVGTACSMASAALADLSDMGIDQIEYATEVALEHHLRLTCDPINGLVQIPCIERNAVWQKSLCKHWAASEITRGMIKSLKRQSTSSPIRVSMV